MRIVATAPVPAVAREAFATLGQIEVGREGCALARAEVLIVRSERIDSEQLDRAADLRAIARSGAGYDNLDVDAATARAIPIVYAPRVGTGPVAEGTLALILAGAKRLRELGEMVRTGAWESRYEPIGLDLDGACVGVIGFGSIGRHVARLCRGLGMHVLAHDPAVAIPRVEAEPVALPELLARAEVITLHCGLTRSTRGLVDRRFLSCVRPGAVLVNAARGPIVESEDALLEALHTGQLGALALDVFPSEPPDPGHPLLRDQRVICTPHTVGLTARWNEQVFRALAHGVEGVLAGRHPDNLLNPQALRVGAARPVR